MEDFFDYDKLKARVYLLQDNDQKNMALVSDEHLLINRKGQKKMYQLQQIDEVRIGVKKSLFPLFLGGIFTPFAVVSYFANMFHPLIHLIGTLLGLLLFYFGWSGRHTVILKHPKGHEEDIFLPSVTPNLEAFVDYVNGLINRGQQNPLAGLIFFKESAGLLSGSVVEPDAFPVKGYTWRQLVSHRMQKDGLTAISPEKAGFEIKFAFDVQMKGMRPVLDRPVSSQAIVQISGPKMG